MSTHPTLPYRSLPSSSLKASRRYYRRCTNAFLSFVRLSRDCP